MIDHAAVFLALRAQVLTLSVCTTGSATLTATATGYARGTGSFVTDGFVIGQEVTPAGFTQTTPGIVTAVTATALTIMGGRTAETPAGACTLSVGLPALRSWENTALTPVANRWFVAEQCLPGPAEQVTLGPQGFIEYLPQYVLTLYGLNNTGISALSKAADAVLALFPPRQSFAYTGGTVAVRADLAPYRGQLRPTPDNGWATITITVPCRVRSPNSI